MRAHPRFNNGRIACQATQMMFGHELGQGRTQRYAAALGTATRPDQPRRAHTSPVV
jgi:hypothetical protein